ncbi:outer membrane protein assembly factor BamE [Acidimangrovimonas sediminis]|uniref:outer membrane protein assembly factor BamE n=1 Tax=Acidimangrovimonas sediminis TaxID=2056283 RepID=UPI000C803B65|nr:outer membrane protein assembly factor BamE [Acidimangrovimonas sediminis]
MRVALDRMRGGLVGVALIMLGACTPIYTNHGYAPDAQQLSDIKVGKDTRDTVRQKIGDPSTAGLMKPAEWFYVQSRFKTVGAGARKEIDRQVVAISFDKAGRVENVERFGLAQGNVVTLSRRVTTQNVKGTTFLRQLFGSIGNFSAQQFLDQQK